MIDTTISGRASGLREEYSDVSGPVSRAAKKRPRERRSPSDYVTDCICFKKKIDDIVAKSKELNLSSMRDVCKIVGCGTKCRLCIPHIKARLQFTVPRNVLSHEAKADVVMAPGFIPY